MIDFSKVSSVTIPEGTVTKISIGDTVLWEEPVVSSDIVPLQTYTFGTSSYYGNASGKLYDSKTTAKEAGVIGATYFVEWDGTLYTCVCRNISYAIDSQYVKNGSIANAIGNHTFISTIFGFAATTTDAMSNNEPFLIALGATEVNIISRDKNTTHTVRVYQ